MDLGTRIDPATGLPDRRPLPPSQNDLSIAGAKRNQELLAWFNSSPPLREDDPRRPLMLLDWLGELSWMTPGGPPIPVWQATGYHGLDDLLDLLARIRKSPDQFDPEATAIGERAHGLITRREYRELKILLDEWNAAPAEQILASLRDRHLDPDAQQVADRIREMIQRKEWGELKRLLNVVPAEATESK